MKLIRWSIVVSCATLFGCGGSGGNTASTAGAPLTPAQYCDGIIASESAWCDYLGKCCSAADKSDTNYIPPWCTSGPTSKADCLASIQKVVDTGHVTFDGTFVEACVAAFSKGAPPVPSSCSGIHAVDNIAMNHAFEGTDQIPACRSTFAGKLAAGAACLYNVECGAGLICRTAAGQPKGTFSCVPEGLTGSPCNDRGDCVHGLACSGDPRQCGPHGSVGAGCIYAADCAEGLICELTCQVPKAIGETCGANDACGGVADCIPASSTCEALKPDGAPCTSSGDCAGRCDLATKTCTSICGGTI